MKAKVVITGLNEYNEEVEINVKKFNSYDTAVDYVEYHEQDFHDDPEIYAVYIKKEEDQ